MNKLKYAIVESQVNIDELTDELFDNYAHDGNVNPHFHGFKDSVEEARQRIEELKIYDQEHRDLIKSLHGKDSPKGPNYRIVVLTVSVEEHE